MCICGSYFDSNLDHKFSIRRQIDRNPEAVEKDGFGLLTGVGRRGQHDDGMMRPRLRANPTNTPFGN